MGLTQITTGGVDDNINIDGDTLQVDGVNNRVGVGITPTAPLHVSGTIQSQTGSTVAQMFTDGGAAYFTSVGSYPMLFQTNGNERMRIDSSGRLLLGHSSSVGDDNNFQLVGSTADGSSATFWRSSSDAGNPALNFVKTRGSVASPSIVSSGDTIGRIRFYGWDGLDSDSRAAEIIAQVDGTPGGDDMPGRLIFSTTSDGSRVVTERMRIDSSGNVGIGTTAPALSIGSVSGKVLHTAGAGTTGARFQNTSGTSIEFFAGSDAVINTGTSTNMAFKINDSEKMRIDSSGRVVIGATSTPVQFSVQNASTSLGIEVDTASGFASGPTLRGYYRPGSAYKNLGITGAQIMFGINDVEKARIDSSGRLLVGTTTNSAPAGYNAKLQLADTSYTGSISMRRDSNDAGSQALIFGKSRGALNGNTIVQNNDTLGYIVWYGADGTDLNSTAAQIHVQIDGTPGSNDMPGRIVFSTTTDGSSAPSAHMIINRNGECRIGHGDSDPVSTDMVHSIQDPNLGAVTSNLARLVIQEKSGNWISFKDGSGTHYGTISRNGSGVSYGSNSDYRLKDNVQNFTGGINLVKQLRPVTFNWNELSGNSDTTSTQRGFIAHEVQAVEPTAVTGEKDEMDRYGDCYDAEGRKTQTNVFERQAKEGETWTFQSEEIRDQQLDSAKLVPILTAALQEAIAKIETLETKVAALEAAE
jgi:hypothetical protein